MVEVEARHLGADDRGVDLAPDRQARHVDRVEALLECGEAGVLLRHRGRRVVRHALAEPRRLERAPVVEQRVQVVRGRHRCGERSGRPEQERPERHMQADRRPRS